jgi:hypothetical protein
VRRGDCAWVPFEREFFGGEVALCEYDVRRGCACACVPGVEAGALFGVAGCVRRSEGGGGCEWTTCVEVGMDWDRGVLERVCARVVDAVDVVEGVVAVVYLGIDGRGGIVTGYGLAWGTVGASFEAWDGVVEYGVFTRFCGTFTGVVKGVGYCVRGADRGGVVLLVDTAGDFFTPLTFLFFLAGLGVTVLVAGTGGGIDGGLEGDMGTVTGRIAD